MLGFVGFSVLGEQMEGIEKLLAAAARDVLFLAGTWLLAAHLFALGLIILLAGLKNVPLLTSVRARRGVRRKLGGASLLILCFAYAGLVDMQAFDFLDEQWWLSLLGLAAFLISARVGFQLLRSGWKYDVVTADQLLAADPRPPVVYLRSFEADREIFLRPDGFWKRAMTVFVDYAVTFSPEQELAEILNRVGPVIAIGKPGEPLPELGAARLYVGDADWKAKVTDMMARAKLVLIRTGSTPNLHWEIEQAMARVPRRQILFVNLGDAKKTAAFDRYFEQRFGPVSRPTTAAAVPVWMKMIFTGRAVAGTIIYFDSSLQPREEPIQLKISWAGLALGMMRPYRYPIQSAIKNVFASLDLPWTARSGQTTAVLLALFAGIFGLHHFYLGDRRRGLKYLAFFWTVIPMFVGWYDTVKLAQMTPDEFDAKYPTRPAVYAPTRAESKQLG
jgi:TM2 domain-containing membrane protein YozV